MPPALAIPPELLAVGREIGGFLVALILLLVLRWFLLGRLKRWAIATPTRADDLVLSAIHTPSLFWCIAVAMAAGLELSTLDASVRDAVVQAIRVLLLISMMMVGASVAGGLATHVLRRQSADGQVPGVGQVVVKTLVFILGGTIVLNAAGVEIAPLLTALGVGGIAVALALQDSLTNFFAGLHILLERPYTLGNFIRIEDGKEGHVVDIGWRTTRIRTTSQNVIVVPNSKMAGSTIVNYHLPLVRSRVSLLVGVDYASDADHVRDVLLDVVRAAQGQLPWLLDDPPPAALVIQLAEFSIDFELQFYITDVSMMPAALDEMYRRVLARFRAEGITIPFPVRTVVMKPG